MNQKSQSVKRLFSLVELLVMLAIFAVLMSLLQPSISNAIQTALKLDCKNKISTIGTAMTVNAYDHGDYFLTLNNHESSNSTYFTLQQRTKGPYAWSLFPYLGIEEDDYDAAGERGLFECPSDELERAANRYKQSYGITRYDDEEKGLVAMGLVSYLKDKKGVGEPWEALSMSRVLNPNQTVMLGEIWSVSNHLEATSYNHLNTAPNITKSMNEILSTSDYHGGLQMSNILMVDTHVEEMFYPDVYSLQGSRPTWIHFEL